MDTGLENRGRGNSKARKLNIEDRREAVNAAKLQGTH